MDFQIFVNKERGTVAVKCKDPFEEYFTEFCNFYKKMEMPKDYKVYDGFVLKYGHQIDKMVGVATCNFEAGDNFEEEYGIALAQERFLKAFEKYRIHLYEMMEDRFSRAANTAYYRMVFCRERWQEREDKIDIIINSRCE